MERKSTHEYKIDRFDGSITFCFDEENADKSIKYIDKLLTLIKANPKTATLIKNVLQNGPLIVDIEPPKNDGYPHAQWDSMTRTISMNLLLTKDSHLSKFLGTFVFELSNAGNPYFNLGTKESELLKRDNFADAESYARMCELAEYETVSRVRDIYHYAHSNKIWKKTLKNISEGANNFPEGWESTNKIHRNMVISHTDIYRKYYDDELKNDTQIKDLEERMSKLA